MGTIGSALGIDVSSWNKANPLAYDGGPALQALRDVINYSTGSGTQFERSMAKRNVERFIKQSLIPVAGVTNDIQQAFDRLEAGDEPLLVMLDVAGFALTKKPGR